LMAAFEMARANTVKAPIIVHGSSTSPTPAYHHRNKEVPKLTMDAGARRNVAAAIPQSIRDRNSHPGICRIATRNSETIAITTANGRTLPGSEYELHASSKRPATYRTT